MCLTLENSEDKMKYLFLFTIIMVLYISTVAFSQDIVVQTTNPRGNLYQNWKNFAEWFPRWQPPKYASQVQATETALQDWNINADSGYYRITISQGGARSMFPDHYPWNNNDWNWNAIGMDMLQDEINPDRKIQIIFHLLGYPKWLMADTDTVAINPIQGWLVGDTKLPVFQGSDSLGLVRYSELITAFCNHYDSLGVHFAMTVMAEPNISTHWKGSWDDANRYYKAFVDGVNASRAGENIKVGGLTWSADVKQSWLDTMMSWAKYWYNFCQVNNVRHDFISYHHYWHNPEDFNTVANAFETAFPNEKFWITEWNYHFKGFVPFDEYQKYVTGMIAATGNLEFIKYAQTDSSHPVMNFYSIIGHYHGYGVCHWRNSVNWDYTASGQALKWLANFEDTLLTINNSSLDISALASSGNSNIKVLLWNYNSKKDTVNLIIPFDGISSFKYKIWKMNKDSTITSLFFHLPYIDSTDLHIPVPYISEQGSEETGEFNREMAIDSNEIVFVDISQIIPTGVTNPIISPGKYTLFQNYPNPFNSQTAIKYQLLKSGNTTLKIYDNLGQCIRILVNEKQIVGRYNIIWDGKNNYGKPVSSGIYFYQLNVNNKSIQTKKLLLLK